MKNHIIWGIPDYDDWKEELEEEYPELTEEKRINVMYEINDAYLDDEKSNLGKLIIPGEILVIADLGLWNGRHSGYGIINSGYITDCLESKYEPLWYVDDYGEFRCDDSHHDGVNHYRYRGIRTGVSESSLQKLLDQIYKGNVDEALLRRLTYRLGDFIGDVYGWHFAGRRPNEQKRSA